MKTSALKAQIAFSLHKINEWLEGQENGETFIAQSRSEVALERQRFKQREVVIQTKRTGKQEEDFRKKQVQKCPRIEKLEKDTVDMLYYGLWQTQKQAEKEISETESRKEDTLKGQFQQKMYSNSHMEFQMYLYSVNKKVENVCNLL